MQQQLGGESKEPAVRSDRFLKILTNSFKNTCVGVYFLVKVQVTKLQRYQQRTSD